MKTLILVLLVGSFANAANRDCHLYIGNASRFTYDSSKREFIEREGFTVERKVEGENEYLTVRGRSDQTGGQTIENRLVRNAKTKDPIEFVSWQGDRVRFEKRGEECFPSHVSKIDPKKKTETLVLSKEICRSIYKHFSALTKEAEGLSPFPGFRLDVLGALNAASSACSKNPKPSACAKFTDRAKTALNAEGYTIYQNPLDKAYELAKNCSGHMAIGDKRQPVFENIEGHLWEDLMPELLKDQFESVVPAKSDKE